MATATQKPTTQNTQSEKPEKTLAPPSPQRQNPIHRKHKEDSSNPSVKPQSVSENSNADSAKANDDDSRAKGTQNPIGVTVVSPAANSSPATDIQKKLRRAERFGVPVQLSEEEKRNSRAERFGAGTGTDVSKTSEEQKRKARAERFGLPVQSVADEEAKKKARLARFASGSKVDTMEDEKRKARGVRFSQTSSGSVSHNGKDNVEPKTTIAGKAVGGA
ncbi:hypothetical protein Ancab_031959 [Ancistrocladus abbreviatus]